MGDHDDDDAVREAFGHDALLKHMAGLPEPDPADATAWAHEPVPLDRNGGCVGLAIVYRTGFRDPLTNQAVFRAGVIVKLHGDATVDVFVYPTIERQQAGVLPNIHHISDGHQGLSGQAAGWERLP